MIIIIITLFIFFLINIIVYWQIVLKQKIGFNKFNKLYKKAFPIIWFISTTLIPIINSSFFQPFFEENISYFHQYWLWFMLIGIIIIIFGIKILSLIKKLLKAANIEETGHNLIKTGVYEIARHPQYFSWILIYLGITFILDSFIAIITIPILLILTELLCFLEEKYLLIPKFGENYDRYKKKTPYKLISPPYNYIFIIMGLIVAYIGFLNIINI
ncbi:MAG: methyltransferase family protein [Candidatus Hodarchaeota archaeon]